MIHSFTRIAFPALAGLAFGFFIGCSTLSSTNKPKNKPGEFTEEQLEKHIASIDSQLTAGSDNPKLLHRKGLYLTKLAQKKENPTNRKSIYRETRRTLNEALQKYDRFPEGGGYNKVEELLKVTWSSEHNQGVQIIQSDSLLDSPSYEEAAAHFNNATIIIPDSSISYKMEARAHYKNQQTEKAIATLEEARKHIDPLPAELLEQLAFLYTEMDEPARAISIYEEADTHSAKNLNLMHGLANAYIQSEHHEKAVGILKLLLKNEPGNVIYGQSLATELYYAGAEKMESAVEGLKNEKPLSQTPFGTADSLFEKAQARFRQLSEENPDNLEIKQSFAHFYKNAASKYQDLLPYLDSDHKQAAGKKMKTFLTSSIPLFRQLAEQHPNEKNIWKNLYETYSYLGMQEEARQAKEKAN